MPFVETTRLRQHYIERGEGETLFFIHGSFATARWWEPVLALLPAGYRAIAPDLRGCGQSQPADSPEAYAVPAQAADLWALAEALALEELHLVGHSYGAAIALQMTLDRPWPVRSLTLLDPPSAYGVETPAEALEYLDRMRTDRDLLARALAATMPARPADAFFHSLVEDAYRQSPAAFTGPALALAHWQVAHRLGSLRLPVLLVWGELDIIVDRASVTEMLLSIPGANYLEVLHGVGHSAHVEAPATFAQVLLRFISESVDATPIHAE
ncbi:MAG: alpha/beta hydrolase [Anaerolineae bacterium]|nr:alpha/beta hydrolase [Anaerolineae bacterium]